MMDEAAQATGFEAAALGAFAFLAFVAFLAGAAASFFASGAAAAAGLAAGAAAGAEAWAKAPNEKVAAIRAAMILFMMNCSCRELLDKELIARESQRGPLRVG